MKKFFVMILAVVMAWSLGACSGKYGEKGQGEESGNQENVLVYGSNDYTRINPALDEHGEINILIFDGLTAHDGNNQVVPGLAREWRFDETDNTYTFYLKEGVRWHDGKPFGAEDVKFTIEAIMDPENGSENAANYEDVQEITVVDEHTVSFKLSEPNVAFLDYMTIPVLPKHLLEGEDMQTADFFRKPVGTGPYKFVSRSLQENVVLERFDGYWGEPAHIKDITLKVLADSDSIVMNLEGGAVDLVARISTAQAAELGEDFEVLEGTMNLVQAMYLNNAAAPFDNEKVRQALCYAVNKQEILDFVSEGKGTLVGSSMFPAFGKYYVEELNDLYTTDLEKAKALLSEAGYPDGFSFTMKVPSNYQQHVDTAQVVAEQLKQINVTANIELIEWETWLSDVYQGRDFEATLVGVDASTLTAGAMLSRFRSDAHNNFVNYNNQEYDAAYAEALAAEAVMDDDKATEAYKKCETILAQTAANVYIQDMCELVAVRKGYTGYTFYPLYIQDFSKLEIE